MKFSLKPRFAAAVAGLALGVLAGGGCRKHSEPLILPPPPPPLGYASDPIWQIQERNGEASDFVIYDHEFAGDSFRLTAAGEDHVKQIAVRLAATPFPVIVQQSSRSYQLDDLQLAVMKVLWERPEASVPDITAAIGADRIPPFLTADAVLQKMETRGLVKHRTEGRQPMYRAAVTAGAVTRTATGKTRFGNEDEPGYAVHRHPDLDMERREVIVRALTKLGVEDADDRVVVGPAIAEGHESIEAERAYARGLREHFFGFFGGGGGGFGGLGGVGGGF